MQEVPEPGVTCTEGKTTRRAGGNDTMFLKNPHGSR